MKYFRQPVTLSDAWVGSNDKLSDFFASSWQRGDSPVPMFVVRLLLAGMSVAILTWSVVESPTTFWLIYLTNWGLVIINLMSVSGLLVSFMAVCKKLQDTNEVPWYISMYWVFFNIGVTIALIVTVLYWLLVFDADAVAVQGPRFLWLDISTHAFNSLLALAELLISRTPVRLLHFYQPFGIALWYSAFTGIYYAAGGTDSRGNPYIYEVLDWRNAGQSGIILAAACAGIILIYLVLWVIAYCRDKISVALIRTISHDLPYTPGDIDTRIV